jgi:RNA polymerase primary sigma factor
MQAKKNHGMESEEIMSQEDFNAGIEWLIEKGQDGGQVTLDDILKVLPDAEHNIDQLDDLFEALLAAGVTYIDETDNGDQVAETAAAEEQPSDTARDLSRIDIEDNVDLYFSEVGDLPLLTAEQEVELAKRIESGRKGRDKLARGARSEKHQFRLRQQVEDGWSAREHLVLANSRLVISVAKKYIGRGVPFLDLIQEGNIGLIRAMKKFDYRRGYKFSTYATWWIRQAVTRAIADQGRTIRVPVHMGDRINKLHRETHRLTQTLGRKPTTDELAEAMDVPPKKIEEMIKAAWRPVSLETPTDSEDDSVLGDFVEDQESPAPPEIATQTLLREQIHEVLNTLPARESRILQLRYGLLDGTSYTLEEVGRKMGVTRERVRQIEAQAFRRLRQSSVSNKLADYLRS